METPTQIQAQVTAYLSSGGRLEAGTAYSAGYDFTLDGADAVRSTLASSLTRANGGVAVAPGSPGHPSSWAASELMSGLASSNPGVTSLFGHFDQTAMETAGGDQVTAAQLAAALPPLTSPEGTRLVFSMGCHSGLSVDDSGYTPGDPRAADLAQALTAGGAAYLASTGFGYGDQVTVGLQERLLQLFAAQLDGAVSLGEAVTLAKQQYFGTQGLYGPYDEKSLSETVLYGLPMYRVGTSDVTRPTPTNATADPVAGVAGLSRQSLSTDFVHEGHTTPSGSWSSAAIDDGTPTQESPLVIAGRPIEPQASRDVTVEDGGQSVAVHGALLTSLTTASSAPVDAVFARPTLDRSADEPEPVTGVRAFPGRLVAVSTSTDPNGLTGPSSPVVRQRTNLLLNPGQFIDDGVGDSLGTGTQVLYRQMGTDVYSSQSTDWTEPVISRVDVIHHAGQTHADVTVIAADGGSTTGVNRTFVLAQAGGEWQPIELVRAGGTWRGSFSTPGAIADDDIRVIVQAVDGAGNVGWSSGKGAGFAAVDAVAAASPTVTLAPAPPSSGWYQSAPSATVSGNSGTSYTVSVDGGPETAYTGAFTPSGLGSGSHTIEVTGSDGGTAVSTFRIDALAPTITPNPNGPPGLAGWFRGPTTVTYSCADAHSGVATCASAELVSSEGSQVVTSTATDAAGNTASIDTTVKIDSVPPTVTSTELSSTTIATGATSTFTVAGSDGTSGVDAAEYFIGPDPGPGAGTALAGSAGAFSGDIGAGLAPGTYLVSGRTRDAAGNWSSTSSATLTVVAGAPGSVQVTVRGPSGVVVHARVRVYAVGSTNPMSAVTTDGNGTASLSLAPGVYFVEVLPPDSRLDRRWFGDASSRATASTITVVSLGHLSITVHLEARS